VTAIKKCISSCSRGLIWKFLIAQEIERLSLEAEKEKSKLNKQEETLLNMNSLSAENFSPENLNILDKIIAMTFERTPIFENEEIHYQVTFSFRFISFSFLFFSFL